MKATTNSSEEIKMQAYHVRMKLVGSITALETVEARHAADAADRAIRLVEARYADTPGMGTVLEAHARPAGVAS